MDGWRGRVGIVTGAGGGLGRAYAVALAEKGMKVIVNDIGCSMRGDGVDEHAAEAVVEEILALGGNAVANFANVADPQAGKELVSLATEKFGRLDVVVNNAGIVGGALFAQMSEEQFDTVVAVSLSSTVRIVRAAWPHLIASGAGRVINITSHSTFGHVYSVPYATAKSAIVGFTRTLAREAATDNIRINCVMPSAFTRQTAQIRDTPEQREYRIREHGIERVVPLVVALASSECQLTGEVLHAGGALFARVGMGMNRGIVDHSPTPETILNRLSEIVLDSPMRNLQSSDEAIAYVHERAAER